MKFRLLVVGKLRDSWAKQASEEYEKRLRPFCPVHLVEVKEQGQLKKQLLGRSCVWLFDERGVSMSSMEFSKKIGQVRDHGTKEICLVIGGPDGFSCDEKKRANLLISLSPLTFPYQLARVIVLEQIYRAFSILEGEPYHRE